MASLRPASAAVSEPARATRSALAPAAKPANMCPRAAGARVAETLGIPPAERTAIPIKHVIVLMQEDRSFDHYLDRLAQNGQPDADGLPAGFANRDRQGRMVAPFHLYTTCLPHDPPHQWESVHANLERRAHGRLRQRGRRGRGRTAVGRWATTTKPISHSTTGWRERSRSPTGISVR